MSQARHFITADLCMLKAEVTFLTIWGQSPLLMVKITCIQSGQRGIKTIIEGLKRGSKVNNT